MKFLIQDYSTMFYTEPKYFNHILNNIDGCSSTLWSIDNKISVYDMMDITKPDIVLSQASLLPKDLIIYLSGNPNIELILNISGITQDELQHIEKVLDINKINCKLCFINYLENYYKSNKFNIVSIYHGVDIFLPIDSNIEYNINKLYLTNKSNHGINDENSYHIISNNKKIESSVDKILSVYDLGGIYKNYNQICIQDFPSPKIVPQIFFDAVYYGKSMLFNGTKEELTEVCKLLKVDHINDMNRIKQIVTEKHTCFNRTKSLLSQLRCTDLVSKLSIIMKEI